MRPSGSSSLQGRAAPAEGARASDRNYQALSSSVVIQRQSSRILPQQHTELASEAAPSVAREPIVPLAKITKASDMNDFGDSAGHSLAIDLRQESKSRVSQAKFRSGAPRVVGVVSLSASSSRTMTPVSSSSALSAEYQQSIGEQMLVFGERRATVVGAGSKGLGEMELWMLPADYGGHAHIERDGGNGPIEGDRGRVPIEGDSGQVPTEGDDGQMPIEGDGGNSAVDDDDASSSISGNSRAASHAGLTAPQGDLGDGLDSLGHKQYTRSARQRISALIHRAKPSRRSKNRSSKLHDSSSSTDAPLSPELETFSPELETAPSAGENHRMPQPALSIKNISGISYSVDQSTSLLSLIHI